MILTPEQKQIIETWDQGMAVMAGAGSGKTTTLVTKCVQLMNRRPDARFAAVSFTERSAGDLRTKLSTQLAPSALVSSWVLTIHGLCGSVVREFPREAGFDGEEEILSEVDSGLLWERAIETLWQENLNDSIRESFEFLLDREKRAGLSQLLKRVKELNSFDVLTHLEEKDDPDSIHLGNVAATVLERYEQLKCRRGVIDFQDLEKGADRALEIPQIRKHYWSRFDLVLIDEFQDTNPVQARILWKFVRPDFSNLCVVGDPKQSIYRFRDADVGVFEEYCSKLPVRHSLTWNFRSLPGIIDYTNSICEKVFEASSLRFEPLIPRRERLSDSDSQDVLKLEIEDPKDLGKWIRKQVASGVPLDEMAVLVRKIRGNERWFKALMAEGIPLVMGSGGLFWQQPRVREMLAFLRWWDNPGNSFSGAVFLRAPWVGISDETLDQWVRQDPTWAAPFFSSGHPIAKALEPYRNKTLSPGMLLMVLLNAEGQSDLSDSPRPSRLEEELGAPLLGLWHRAEELSSRGLNFRQVVLEFKSAAEENRREKEVPVPRQSGHLLVLTIHGAKGLEFGNVILIDFAGPQRSHAMPILFWDREEGCYFASRDENGNRQKDAPVEKKWRDLENQKSLAESKRLFYVALTRAKNRLILVCPTLSPRIQASQPAQSDQDQAAARAAFRRDDWRGWLDHSGVSLSIENAKDIGPSDLGGSQNFLPKEGSHPLVDLRIQPTPVQWTRMRHSVTEWNLLTRCARAYEWKFIRPMPPTPKEEPEISDGEAESPEADLESQEIGTQVHSCLERRDDEGLRTLEQKVGSERFQAQPVITWASQSPWMQPSDLSMGRKVWTELNFEVPIEGEILVGTLDRLVREQTQQGPVYSIIDFKITKTPMFRRKVNEYYQAQLELYAWALTRLQPGVFPSQVRAYVVNISPHEVKTFPVSVGNLSVEKLRDRALTLIQGKKGDPNPGTYCRFCDFKKSCPDAQLPSLNSNQPENPSSWIPESFGFLWE